MKTITVLMLSVCFLFTASQSGAVVYQWTDDKGVVHFTDNGDKIPEKYRKKVKTLDNSGGAVTITPPAVSPDRQSERQQVEPGGNRQSRNDEAVWRARFSSLREEKELLENGLAAKKEKLATLRRKKAIYQRGSDRIAYNQQNEDLERDEARIKELERKLQELDAEAARAGVPAEWRQ